jgi:predicted DNA-binding protein (MmcQ/YjbR family)
MVREPKKKQQQVANASGLVHAEQTIAAWAAAYPEVVEEAPWGHRAFKVRGKTFMFLGSDAEGLGFSLKLPQSGLDVLGLPFAEPTHYGLGKSGWVSCSFGPGEPVPLELVELWLRESFVAIAPKKLVATLEGTPAPEAKRARASAPETKSTSVSRKAPAAKQKKTRTTATTKRTVKRKKAARK